MTLGHHSPDNLVLRGFFFSKLVSNNYGSLDTPAIKCTWTEHDISLDHIQINLCVSIT